MKHLKLEDFPARNFDKLRFGDTDMIGHVNNAVFMSIFETGRFEIFEHVRSHLSGIGAIFVIARISVDYWREML